MVGHLPEACMHTRTAHTHQSFQGLTVTVVCILAKELGNMTWEQKVILPSRTALVL